MIQINLSCLYHISEQLAPHSVALYGLIEDFRTHVGCQLFHTGDTQDEALARKFSYESLLFHISKNEKDNIVIFLWNGKTGVDGAQIGISTRSSDARIPSAFSTYFYGSIDQLFAFEPFLIRVADALGAFSCRIMSGDVLRFFVRQNVKGMSTLGEIAWLHGDHPLDVEGFEARQHGKGTLYRMQRDRAEEDTEARAALIAGLRARLALE